MIAIIVSVGFWHALLTHAADSTPGSDCAVANSVSRMVRCALSSSIGPRITRLTSSTRSTSYPIGSRMTAPRLRTNSAAPTSRTTEQGHSQARAFGDTAAYAAAERSREIASTRSERRDQPDENSGGDGQGNRDAERAPVRDYRIRRGPGGDEHLSYRGASPLCHDQCCASA